jgi:putative endonuclease
LTARVIVARMSTSTHHNQVLGFRGERIAEKWLERKGWRVIQRRFRDGHRDLDLIAERDGTVAFVEVKARSGEQFGTPIEAVDWRKKRELVRSARMWISRHGRFGESYRFDVIGVLISPDHVFVRHVENAFGIVR